MGFVRFPVSCLTVSEKQIAEKDTSIQVTPTTLFYTSLVSLLTFRLRDVAYINKSIEEALKHNENDFRQWVSRKYQFATLTEKHIAVSIKLIFQ